MMLLYCDTWHPGLKTGSNPFHVWPNLFWPFGPFDEIIGLFDFFWPNYWALGFDQKVKRSKGQKVKLNRGDSPVLFSALSNSRIFSFDTKGLLAQTTNDMSQAPSETQGSEPNTVILLAPDQASLETLNQIRDCSKIMREHRIESGYLMTTG